MNHPGNEIYKLLEPEDYVAAKRALGLLPERFKQDIEALAIPPVKLPIEGGRGLALRLEEELAKHSGELATPEGAAVFFDREIALAHKGQRTPIDEITGALLFRTRRTREAHEADGVAPEMLTLAGEAVRDEQRLRQHREVAEAAQQSASAMDALVKNAERFAALAEQHAQAAARSEERAIESAAETERKNARTRRFNVTMAVIMALAAIAQIVVRFF